MAVVIAQNELKELYDKDFPQWVEINLNFLREKKYDQVDWENLLEEIEDMGSRHLESCISYLAVILEHLYKWDNFKSIAGQMAGEEKTGYDWINSIEDSKDEILLLFDKHPSLKAKLPNEIETAWKEAIVRIKKWLRRKMQLDPDNFDIPKKCPYTYEEAMNRDVRKENDINYWLNL